MWLICINNNGYDVSLKQGKTYRSVYDKEAEEIGLVRIVDESGESYYYPMSFFSSGDAFSIEIEQLKNRIKTIEYQMDKIKEALT